MKIIVLHGRHTNDPIIVRVSAITTIRKCLDIYNENKKEEYSEITVGNYYYVVKEPIDVVMRRIKAIEDKNISRKEREIVNEDKKCKPLRF